MQAINNSEGQLHLRSDTDTLAVPAATKDECDPDGPSYTFVSPPPFHVTIDIEDISISVRIISTSESHSETDSVSGNVR